MGDAPCACDDKGRYIGEQKNGGGEEIPVANARTYINNYQANYKTTYKGAFISKKALDDIFCSNAKANGVFCYFAMKNGDPASFTVVIESGVTDVTIIKKMESNNSAVFMGEVMCPSICGASGENE